MKNTIKFRAFDGQTMQKDVVDLSANNLMQWTGLKDKAGNEIYEGDIVEFVGGTTSVLHCGIYAYQHHKIGTLLVVQRLPSGFTLRQGSEFGKNEIPNIVGNVGQYDFWNHQRSLKVVGNVFENPELIQ